MKNDLRVILWDYDGVLMNSNPVRNLGFEKVLNEFPPAQVAQLMEFHRDNGGLSRYVKFRYFFETIRGEKITEEAIKVWAEKFSVIMKDLLINPELLILETLSFVKRNYQKYPMHIVSGSDGEELRYLCKMLDIAKYFKSIHGSPTPKKQLIDQLLKENNYANKQCILIGDAINDFDAAQFNSIDFMAYNNASLDTLSTKTIAFND
jgi:phosphoglycolate phosphatase-like HAD superfamily hydrolase